MRSAKSAKDEAAKLLQSAADKAQSRADAAAATRERLLSPDDQKIVRQNREDKGRAGNRRGRPYGRNRKRRSLCRAQRIRQETARHEREDS